MKDIMPVIQQLRDLGYPPPNILRAVCKLEGVKYSDIAEAVEEPLATITAHMNDARYNARTRKKIARFFGLDVDQLFEDEW